MAMVAEITHFIVLENWTRVSILGFLTGSRLLYSPSKNTTNILDI